MSNSLDFIPDISFTDNMTYEDVRGSLISFYKEEYKNITGEEAVLQVGSRERLELDACAIMFFQILQVIEFNGRMNCLKTSEGAYLDNIGALFHQIRTPATASKTVLRFHVAQPQDFVIPIVKGTEAAAGDIVFATEEYAEILPGQEYVDVDASCTVAGSDANGLVPGEVNIMMKDIAYIASVENMELTHDGQDVLSDEDFRELIFLSTGAEYSGTLDGYEYRSRKINPDIEDIYISSDSPGIVNIIFTLTGGDIPSEEACRYLQEELSHDGWKEMTDCVVVSAPEVVEYDIDFIYYLESGEDAEVVKGQIQEAVDDFERWQAGQIGRDINDSKLIYMLLGTDVKRISCSSPTHRKLGRNQLAKVANVNIVYGGLDDD